MRIVQQTLEFYHNIRFPSTNRELLEKVLEVCYSTDWKEEVAPKNTSSKKIQTWRIYKYLKEQIPELE